MCIWIVLNVDNEGVRGEKKMGLNIFLNIVLCGYKNFILV